MKKHRCKSGPYVALTRCLLDMNGNSIEAFQELRELTVIDCQLFVTKLPKGGYRLTVRSK